MWDIIKWVSETFFKYLMRYEKEKKKKGILKGYGTKLWKVCFDLNNFQKIVTDHKYCYNVLCKIKCYKNSATPIFSKTISGWNMFRRHHFSPSNQPLSKTEFILTPLIFVRWQHSHLTSRDSENTGSAHETAKSSCICSHWYIYYLEHTAKLSDLFLDQ